MKYTGRSKKPFITKVNSSNSTELNLVIAKIPYSVDSEDMLLSSLLIEAYGVIRIKSRLPTDILNSLYEFKSLNSDQRCLHYCKISFNLH